MASVAGSEDKADESCARSTIGGASSARFGDSLSRDGTLSWNMPNSTVSSTIRCFVSEYGVSPFDRVRTVQESYFIKSEMSFSVGERWDEYLVFRFRVKGRADSQQD